MCSVIMEGGEGERLAIRSVRDFVRPGEEECGSMLAVTMFDTVREVGVTNCYDEMEGEPSATIVVRGERGGARVELVVDIGSGHLDKVPGLVGDILEKGLSDGVFVLDLAPASQDRMELMSDFEAVAASMEERLVSMGAGDGVLRGKARGPKTP